MERKELVGGEGREARRYPPGFRFAPTDEELVKYYLLPVVENRLPAVFIPTLDVYGTEPWRLPRDLTYSVHGEFYCFARRTRCSESGSRAKRTVRSEMGEAMSGTWHANSNPDGISVDGKVVAKRRLLSFQNGSSDKNSNWVMHEYCLEDGKKFQDVVLCRIRNRKADKEEEEEEAPRLLSPTPPKKMRAAESTGVDAEGSHTGQGAMTPRAYDEGDQALMVATVHPEGTDQVTTKLAAVGPLPRDTISLPANGGEVGMRHEGSSRAAACFGAATAAPVQKALPVDPTLLKLLQGLHSGRIRADDVLPMMSGLGEGPSRLPHMAVPQHHEQPATPWSSQHTTTEGNPRGWTKSTATPLTPSFANRMAPALMETELQAPPTRAQGNWPASWLSPPRTAPAWLASAWRPDWQNQPPSVFKGSSPALLDIHPNQQRAMAAGARLPAARFNAAQPPTRFCMAANPAPTAWRAEQGGMTQPGVCRNGTPPVQQCMCFPPPTDIWDGLFLPFLRPHVVQEMPPVHVEKKQMQNPRHYNPSDVPPEVETRTVPVDMHEEKKQMQNPRHCNPSDVPPEVETRTDPVDVGRGSAIETMDPTAGEEGGSPPS